jgi:hypothetical protein
MNLGIGHTSVYIYDRIDVASPLGYGTNVIHRVGFNELTGFCDYRSFWVIWAYALLTPMYEQGSFQYPSDTAETNGKIVSMYHMMPDNFSTAFKYCAEFKNTSDQKLSYRMGTSMWSGHTGWYPPLECSKPKTTNCIHGIATRPIVIGQLNVAIKRIPFALPAPNGRSVHSAVICHHLRGHTFGYKQLHSNCSRLR